MFFRVFYISVMTIQDMFTNYRRLHAAILELNGRRAQAYNARA